MKKPSSCYNCYHCYSQLRICADRYQVSDSTSKAPRKYERVKL